MSDDEEPPAFGWFACSPDGSTVPDESDEPITWVELREDEYAAREMQAVLGDDYEVSSSR